MDLVGVHLIHLPVTATTLSQGTRCTFGDLNVLACKFRDSTCRCWGVPPVALQLRGICRVVGVFPGHPRWKPYGLVSTDLTGCMQSAHPRRRMAVLTITKLLRIPVVGFILLCLPVDGRTKHG